MKIEINRSPTEEELRPIKNGLQRYNEAYVSGAGDVSFAVLLRAADGAIQGGISARAGRGWLKIGSLWVAPELRGHGFGRQLLTAAEGEGVRQGCHSAYLDTFDFQAPDFYRRCGYTVFGELPHFPDHHTRYFMRKSLSHEGDRI